MAATIADVAAKAGVSTATVSRVLSGADPTRPETRERVLAAVQALDYRPSGVARSLKLRTTRTIGLLITDILNPYYPQIVRAVEDAARSIGYSVLLCNGDEDPAREAAYLELLAERRVDGILIAASRLTERHARWLIRSPIPIVLVNSGGPDGVLPSVRSDNQAGGSIAAAHLLDLGHRELAYLAGPPTDEAELERQAGVRRALQDRALEPDQLAVAQGDGHVTGGARAAADLLAAAPQVTGLVCYNDLSAIGAIRALRAAGRRVPEEVSVVGFDDIDEAQWVEPPLTTVRQQTAEMGRLAVEALARRLPAARGERAVEPDPAEQSVLLPVTLVVRRSTARPADHSRRT